MNDRRRTRAAKQEEHVSYGEASADGRTSDMEAQASVVRSQAAQRCGKSSDGILQRTHPPRHQRRKVNTCQLLGIATRVSDRSNANVRGYLSAALKRATEAAHDASGRIESRVV